MQQFGITQAALFMQFLEGSNMGILSIFRSRDKPENRTAGSAYTAELREKG